MPAQERPRITIDVTVQQRRRLRMAASRRDESLAQYVQRALDRALAEDLPPALHAADDPLLAELWDNAADEVWDHV